MCSVNSSVGCNPAIMFPYTGYAPRFGTWNFTVEHRFGPNTLVRAAYEGSSGVHLFASREILDATPTSDLKLGSMLLQSIGSVLGTPAGNAAGIHLPFASFPTSLSVSQALTQFPQYYGVDESNDSDMSGHSTFHALELSVEHHMSHGLWVQASYTWAKTIDNTEGGNPALAIFEGNGGGNSSQDEYDRRADKAVSNSDIPQRVVISYVYNFPVGRGRHFLSNTNAVANAVLGGWRVTGIQQYQSGVPIVVYSGQTTGLRGQGQERANVISSLPLKNPAWTGDPNAIGSNGQKIPYINPAAFARPPEFTFGNSPAFFGNLRNPGILNEDISLAKDFFLMSEQRKLTIQANWFNAFNRTIFGGPNSTVESAAFGTLSGQVTPVSVAGREIQFMLRLTF